MILTARRPRPRPSATEAQPLLRLRDVHSFIGESHILQGVSFDVARGRVTALLGRNGVGKTSTLRAVLGLMKTSGSIEFQGQSIRGNDVFAIARLGIGYVPEDRDVFHGLTVAENLRLAERRGEVADYEGVYDLFPDLYERRKQRAGTMSGGQQQMLSIARVLLNRNSLLLIDEPTKGLAPKIVTDVAKALDRIKSETTILLVEQNLEVARRVADDVVVLAEGEVQKAGSAADVFAETGSLKNLLGVSSTAGGR